VKSALLCGEKNRAALHFLTWLLLAIGQWPISGQPWAETSSGPKAESHLGVSPGFTLKLTCWSYCIFLTKIQPLHVDTVNTH